MKKTLLLLACCLSQVLLFGQDCKNYIYLQANKTIEMTIYNRKGAPDGKQVYKISEVSNSAGTVSARVNSEMFDKKGKSITKASGNYKCTGGMMMIDMKMSIPSQQMEQFKNAEVKAEDVYIEYPANMNVGDQLKDGNFNMDIDNNGMKQSLSMLISDRKVEGKETVTTTAGTWECYKISSKMRLTIKTMGVGIPINMEQTEWFAPGFGVVKTESKHGGTAITAIN